MSAGEPPGGESERTSFGDLVGRAPAMRALFRASAALAGLDTSVLLCGEAGTGKDSLARCLHRGGPRAAAPFIVIDCSAIAPRALEEELLGRPDGEVRGRPGALELSRGGTLVLDEVGDLPLPLQSRLHEVLATRMLRRVSGLAPLPIDTRIIAVSKRKLTAEVERGKFDPGLLKLLAGAELTLPPLRERRDDIPLLAQTLLERSDEGAGLTPTREALAALSLHDWPGNVRELRNLVERLAYAVRAGGAAGHKLGALLLSSEPQSAAPERRASSLERDRARFEPGLSYREERAEFEADFEKRYVAWLLDRHDGNVSAAARAADMDRKYLYKLAKKHALKPTS